MPNNAFYIVEEFLRSNDPQARKNALMALAVMDADAECIERLGGVAFTDGDEGVRRRAVEEIVLLPDPALPHATRVLHAGLSDQENGQKAYAALGRLKGLGKQVPHGIPLSPLARLQRAWMMNTYLNPVRNMAYRMRAWKHALVGAIASLAVLWPLYVLQGRWDKELIIMLPIPLTLLAVLTCIVTTQRTTPINLHLDRKAAFLVESLTPVILALPFSILFLLIAFTNYTEQPLYMCLTLGLPLTIGVVRAATLLSFGVARRRRLNIAFQVCVAVATVLLLLAAYNYAVWAANPVIMSLPETEVEWYEPAHRIVEALWVCLLPLAGAAALAFASIDKLSPPVRPFAGRLGSVFCGVTLGLALALLAAILVFERAKPQGYVNINSTINGVISWLKAARAAN